MAETPAFQADESKRLGAIANRVNSGEFVQALDQINAELATERTSMRRGKLMGQVARTLFKRGKFSEASAAFSQAAKLTSGHARDWFPLQLSQIKALIKDVSLTEAVAAANACYARAEEKLAAFERARAGAAEELRRAGRVTVPIKPLRLSVVASEIGDLFMTEGELDTAKFFFEKAVAGNPRGGTRARQGLAEIALRMDDAPTAFQRSVEALTLGKFQAKTIASWKPFFAARRKLGQTGLSAEFVAAIKACRPSVRARTTLTVVRELRSSNDPQWKAIADEWLAAESQKFPEVAAELRKMQMSETKRALSDPFTQLAAATALLGTEKLAPHEWLAGAKESVRASLFAKLNPRTSQLVTEGRKRFGASFVPQLQHSLALSCMMANRHDLARPLLRSAIGLTAAEKNHIWSKAQWALGRMESYLKNYADAVAAFGEVASASQVPAPFRLQARMLWAENLLLSGDSSAIATCAGKLPQMLQGIQDYDLLLNFARQLSRSKGEFKDVAKQIFTMGETQALQAFAAAAHPSQAIDILFKLTRRQVFDFGRAKAAVQMWEGLSEEKKLWLWNNDNRWWGYLAFVLLAYLRSGQREKAAELASATLDDPSTPREALPAVLVPYYEELILKKAISESLEAFRWIVTENPTRAQCAAAFYWLALDAFRTGQPSEAARLCRSLLAANQNTEVTYDQWMFEAKARLLLSDIEGKPFSAQATQFDETWLSKARLELNRHLALLAQ